MSLLNTDVLNCIDINHMDYKLMVSEQKISMAKALHQGNVPLFPY